MDNFFSNLGSGLKTVFIDGPKKIFNAGKKGAEITKEIVEDKPVNVNAVEGPKKGIVSKIITWHETNSPTAKKRAEYEASLVPLVLDPNGEDSKRYDTKQTWKYVARNHEGKVVTNYFQAFSKMEVYSFLTDQNMIPYSIETNSKENFIHGTSSTFQTKIKTKDLVFWLTQLSTYIRAGIPLTDAVKVLTKQNKTKSYNMIYDSIVYELTMGQPFSEALNRQGAAFPALLVNMIKSAEMTGNIEDTLDEMADYYQEIEDLKRAIVSALAYPVLVMVFAIAIVVFMLTYIVPQFVNVYASMGSEIPKITQITLDLSEFLQTKYMWIISIVVIVVGSYIFLFKKVKAFKVFMQSFFMKLPVIGNLIISKEMSMFARTFSSLQKNNVLLTDSIDILAKITNNEIYKELELRTIDNLIKGNKMSETFKDHWAIPDVAYFMIVTGESTGELAEMLEKVADFYSKQEKASVAMIKTFIEPLMILFLAVMVGFILIAILVPMFGIYSTVT